jgi:Ca-activated chloride channel family protein
MVNWRVMILVGFVLGCSAAPATPLEAYWHNVQGLARFKQKSYYAAYQQFLQALDNDPFNAEILMNLALTFEVNEEYEKAEKAYLGALKFIPESSALRFAGLFNLAGVLGKQKKIPEALGTYQAALTLHPDSLEVKTNIELLWQQGGGSGEGKEDKDQKDKGKDKSQPKDGEGNNKDQQKDQARDPDQKEAKKQPKPFESRELTPQDVKKILDEIKNQEQSVRANEYERNVKEAPRGKDW